MFKFTIAVLIFAFFGSSAIAGELTSHQLVLTLPSGSAWTQKISTTTSQSPENILQSGGNVTLTYRNTFKRKGKGYAISRQVTESTDHREPMPGMPDISDITARLKTAMDKVDYITDAYLRPKTITNLADIQRMERLFLVNTFGSAVTNELKADIKPSFSQDIIAGQLGFEVLISALYRNQLIVGEETLNSDTIFAFTGTYIAAQSKLALVRWNEAADEAVYKLTIQADPKAKEAVTFSFFLDFLYQMSTMSEAEIAHWKQEALNQARLSNYKNDINCDFSASIKSGLVTKGACESQDILTSALFSQSKIVRTEIVQNLVP